ncbi:uncharacterized protein [Typha angustifolia]|uniref:uncharacterized protein n=1 Tax=Typha angustifolia TaxID=59011 RepID=UPI003C307F45
MRREEEEEAAGEEPPTPLPTDAVAVVITGGGAEMASTTGSVEEKGKGKGEGEAAVDLGAEKGGCVAIELGKGGDGNWEGEKVCRICHLSPEREEGGGEGGELIQLGCGCKDELGIAHRHCAEAWFRIRGNRSCEICGSNAKNITGLEDGRFMEEWHERRVLFNRNSTERGGCWRRQPFCNFLMACLVIAFILPWFLRVNMF